MINSRKLFLTALMAGTALGFSAGAHAEGEAAINTNSSVNASPPAGSATMSQSGTTDMQSHTASQPGTIERSADSSAAASGSASLDSERVAEVQRDLRNEGFQVSVDGIWGPETSEAIRNFQQANNLTATGTLTSETVAALEGNTGRDNSTQRDDINNY